MLSFCLFLNHYSDLLHICCYFTKIEIKACRITITYLYEIFQCSVFKFPQLLYPTLFLFFLCAIFYFICKLCYVIFVLLCFVLFPSFCLKTVEKQNNHFYTNHNTHKKWKTPMFKTAVIWYFTCVNTFRFFFVCFSTKLKISNCNHN